MKKGFTLIELLAVIVILAIIAVIATPIVLNLIGNTKENAMDKTAALYLKAAEQAIMDKKKDVRGFTPSECGIQDDGNLFCDEEVVVEIEANGEKPKGGIINFENGKVKNMELIYETVIVRQDSSGKISQDKSIPNPITENIVYFDVKNGALCSETDYDISNSSTGYNGLNGIGSQTSCLKFYSFNKANGKIDLILDHNTTAVNMWYDGYDNTQGPVAALAQLEIDTQDWHNTLNARLISAAEVAQIVGYTSWENKTIATNSSNNDNGNWYFFNTKTTTASTNCKAGNTSECTYRWLYDRTSTVCKSEGCLNNSDQVTSGFWTDTAVPIQVDATLYMPCDGYVAYGVSHSGRVGSVCVNNANHYGIRPVITINQ